MKAQDVQPNNLLQVSIKVTLFLLLLLLLVPLTLFIRTLMLWRVIRQHRRHCVTGGRAMQ